MRKATEGEPAGPNARGTKRAGCESRVNGRAGTASFSSGASRFRARLEPDHTALRWTIARVPAGVVEGWTQTRRLRVRGEIHGVVFRTSLFPTRDGSSGYMLLINKHTQRAAGVRVHDEVEIGLEPDLEERPSALPAELIASFEGDRALRRWAEALSESTRREIGKWIAGVKGADAQARRAGQMAERLLLAMEGEERTPPVLEAAFVRHPGARRGWEAMTVAQRRGHLMGIFYYRTPDGRERRAAKAVEEAMRGRTSRADVDSVGE